MPSISVIITCYAEGNLLSDAVESVLTQTQLPQEIVIVYDASGDRTTIEVCKQLESNPLVKLIWRTENGGTAIAREEGFSHAQAEIFVPLDADDLLPQEALALISHTFSQNPTAEFVYGNYLRQDQKERNSKLINPGNISLGNMLKAKPFSLSSNWHLIGTTPLRRSLWQKIGGYDLSFGNQDLHDVDFWIRAIATSQNYIKIDRVIYVWRKYLGKNSRKVTPLAWNRIAQKYVQIYAEVGLAVRCQELILLNSKWQKDSNLEIRFHSQVLKQAIFQNQPTCSSLIILILPGFLIRILVDLVILKHDR
jgi:glycosyltransferase involved in cell wall biosynthesis